VQVLVGTSGFAYKEWRGTFYPAGLKAADMLRFYAERLPTVEVNNTFYRMPKASVLAGWAEQVPAGFVFVLKASQRITHHKRLQATAAEPLSYLLDAAAGLGPRLGPLLFQLPPSFRKDVSRLREFLALLPDGSRAAFEFRHASWLEEDVFAALREKNLAFVAADTDESGEAGAPIVPTADWGYLRLRRSDYAEKDLDEWRDRIRAQPWEQVFVFFKHEDAGKGPALAQRLTARLGG
jgi:uncharacterized protein YecE (DUF72 family)